MHRWTWQRSCRGWLAATTVTPSGSNGFRAGSSWGLSEERDDAKEFTCGLTCSTVSPFFARPMNHPKYISVDDLQAQTSLHEAAAKCGATLDVHGSGKQVRLDCPFGCAGDHAGKRELSVDTGNPQKVFACHAYNCQMRGNLLTLMHGWLNGTRPTGDKLKGEEFKRVRNVLAGEPTPP